MLWKNTILRTSHLHSPATAEKSESDLETQLYNINSLNAAAYILKLRLRERIYVTQRTFNVESRWGSDVGGSER